jgi:hypothetical protein
VIASCRAPPIDAVAHSTLSYSRSGSYQPGMIASHPPLFVNRPSPEPADAPRRAPAGAGKRTIRRTGTSAERNSALFNTTFGTFRRPLTADL